MTPLSIEYPHAIDILVGLKEESEKWLNDQAQRAWEENVKKGTVIAVIHTAFGVLHLVTDIPWKEK